MIEKNPEDKLKYLLRLMVLLCVICMCMSCSTNVSPHVTDTNTAGDADDITNSEQRARDVALRSATRAVTGGFRPSLEMKENSDFLLSPALLMQEVLSDEIVTT